MTPAACAIAVPSFGRADPAALALVRRARRASSCVGDLLLDVVVAPERAARGRRRMCPGRVSLRQGGSAATTARWLARLGARSMLVTAVGRDAAGRALLEEVRADGVTSTPPDPSAGGPAGSPSSSAPSGERSFVADRSRGRRARAGGPARGVVRPAPTSSICRSTRSR